METWKILKNVKKNISKTITLRYEINEKLKTKSNDVLSQNNKIKSDEKQRGRKRKINDEIDHSNKGNKKRKIQEISSSKDKK